ncbi:hypothetical protein HYT52_04495 [Candidatus Woesearchaeota archaeon]|nr:hypothetical protein [Candidatus Woesearchaeota archaeon]
MKQFTITLAKKAGTFLLQHFQKDPDLISKRTVAKGLHTRYDQKSDQIIVSAIKKKYPAHNILTEEIEADFPAVVEGLVQTMALAPDRDSIWIGSTAGVVYHFSLAGQVLHAPIELGPETTLTGATLVDSRHLAFVSEASGEVIFVDTKTGLLGRRWQLPGVSVIAPVDNDRQLVTLRVLQEEDRVALSWHRRLP